MTSFYNAFLVQLRVINALMLREIHTIHGNSKLGYLWVVIQYTFSIAVFMAIREYTNAHDHFGMSSAIFLITGFFVWYIVSDSIKKCMSAVSANKALLTYPQVKVLDLMLSRVIVLWLTQLIVNIAILTVLTVFDIEFEIHSITLVYLVVFVAPLLGLGLGLIFSSLAVILPFIEKVVPMILRILFFISGVFFSVSTFNHDIASLLALNPILDLIELLRASVSTSYPLNYSSWSYVLNITLVSLFFGFILERYVRSLRKRI